MERAVAFDLQAGVAGLLVYREGAPTFHIHILFFCSFLCVFEHLRGDEVSVVATCRAEIQQTLIVQVEERL